MVLQDQLIPEAHLPLADRRLNRSKATKRCAATQTNLVRSLIPAPPVQESIVELILPGGLHESVHVGSMLEHVGVALLQIVELATSSIRRIPIRPAQMYRIYRSKMPTMLLEFC